MEHNANHIHNFIDYFYCLVEYDDTKIVYRIKRDEKN